MSLLQFWADGGLSMYIVLSLGISAALVGGLTALVLGALGKRWPAPLAWLFPAGVLATGAIGGWRTSSMVESMFAPGVSGGIDSINQGPLAADGTAISLYPLVLALGLSSATLLAIAVPMGLAVAVRPGPEPRPDAGGLAGVFLGVTLGGVVGVLVVGMGGGFTDLARSTPWVQLVVSITLIAGFVLASGAASARRPGAHAPLEEGRLHEARIAGTRLFIAVSGVLAVVALARAGALLGEANTLQALASAPPELRTMLYMKGVDQQSAATLWGWGLVMPFVFMGLGSTMGFLGRLDGRSVAHAFLGLGALALAQLSQLPLSWSLDKLDTVNGQNPPWLDAADALGDDLFAQVGLPVTSACAVTRDGSWAGLPAAIGSPPHCRSPLDGAAADNRWTLVIRSPTPAISLVDRSWGANSSALDILVKSEGIPGLKLPPAIRYSVVPWHWLKALPTDGFIGLNDIKRRGFTPEQAPSETVIIWDTPDGDRFLRLSPDDPPLTLESLARTQPFSKEREEADPEASAGAAGKRLVFIPGDSWTVGELLHRCRPDNQGNQCVLMPRDAVPFPKLEEPTDDK